MNRNQKIGLYGEELAAKYLIKKGYKIRDKRFYTRFGEIDLIAEKGDEFVFVEVKTRTNTTGGRPEESVTYHKIKKMNITARRYAQKYDIVDKDFRLDCVAIVINKEKKTAKIQHYENIS